MLCSPSVIPLVLVNLHILAIGSNQRLRVRVVVMDLSETYRRIIRKYFPNAKIVADRFHVIRWVNHQFLKTWSDWDPVGRKNRGLLSLIRRHPWNLSEEQQSKLNHYFDQNPGLREIYEFKSELVELLLKKHQTQREARNLIPQLLWYIEECRQSPLPRFQELARTLKRWLEPIARMWRFTKTNGLKMGTCGDGERKRKQKYDIRYQNVSKLTKKAVKRVSFSFVPAIAVIALLVPYFIKTISETNRDGAHAIERMAILGDTDESLKQRSGKLPVMWDFASRYPFGVGGARVGGASTLFTKQIENDPYTDQKVWFADSLFINLLIELGVPGTLIYIALMGAIWLQAFKNVVRPGIEDLRYVSVAILSYLTVMYVLSWGGNSFTAGAALPWFWMTGGMVFGIKEIQESYLSKSSLLSQDRMNQSEAQPQATPHKINAA